MKFDFMWDLCFTFHDIFLCPKCEMVILEKEEVNHPAEKTMFVAVSLVLSCTYLVLDILCCVSSL